MLRSMQRQESDVPPHLPVHLERLRMRGQGLHPTLGLQKPLQKTKHLQKKPSKTPSFLLHSYFFITSSPAQVQQNLLAFPNTIPWQILVLVVCVDSQGRGDATRYFTVTAVPQRYSLDLSTKNCSAEVLCDLLKYQVVNQSSDIVHLHLMFSPRVVAYREEIWNARSLFGHRHRFNWVLANSTVE